MIGQPAVPDLSSALLEGEDKISQIRVIRVLGRIDPTAVSAVPGLTRALSSQHLHVRIATARALPNIGPPSETALPMLVAGLSERSSEARQAMAACLARAGAAAEPALPSLLPLLADPDRGVREAAAAALKEIGPPAVPALIELVQARDAQRLKAWVESWNRILPWRTPPKNDVVVIDSWESWKNLCWTAYDILEEHTRLEAAQEAALGILGKLRPASSAAVPAATQALADPNPRIQLAAVHALGQIGSGAKSAIPNLVQILLHGNESCQGAAAEALKSIDDSWASYPAVAGVMAILAKRLSYTGPSGELAAQRLAVAGVAAVPALIDTFEFR